MVIGRTRTIFSTWKCISCNICSNRRNPKAGSSMCWKCFQSRCCRFRTYDCSNASKHKHSRSKESARSDFFIFGCGGTQRQFSVSLNSEDNQFEFRCLRRCAPFSVLRISCQCCRSLLFFQCRVCIGNVSLQLLVHATIYNPDTRIFVKCRPKYQAFMKNSWAVITFRFVLSPLAAKSGKNSDIFWRILSYHTFLSFHNNICAGSK